MAAMQFSEVFISWILMLHDEADTSLLLSFITKPIPITFSVRQGDPLSMILYLIYVEPLLLRLEELTKGVALKAKLEKEPRAPLVSVLQEELEGFVDDIETLCSTDEDFLKVNKCVEMFERVSGAILNRSSKSVVLGLGNWKQREYWPLPWLKTVRETKVFGFILTWKYSEIIDKNWASQLKKFTVLQSP